MRIFQKATVYAYKKIDDNLSAEEVEKQIEEFEGDLRLDLDNLGYGGNSDYKFIHESDTMSEKEFRKEEGYAYADLLENEVNFSRGSTKLFDVLHSEKPETTHKDQLADARYSYKKSLLNPNKFFGNYIIEIIKEDEKKVLEVLDKTCYIDAFAIFDLTKNGYGITKAQDLVKEISPVVGMRSAPNHPKGFMGYYEDVEDAMVKVSKIIDKMDSKDTSKNSGR